MSPWPASTPVQSAGAHAPQADAAVSLGPPDTTAAAPRTAMDADVAAVTGFWCEAGAGFWFAKDPAFDRRFRERFLSLHETASRGECAAWMATAEGALALLLLLDQFPRNAFRGTSRMYSSDPLARDIARLAVKAGFDRHIPAETRVFMYLPFGHSEDLADQDLSVELSRPLAPLHFLHAERHRDIVRRYGRFPHRNSCLGRTMTAAEQSYLDAGGFAG